MPPTSRRIRLILDLDPHSTTPVGTLTAHSGSTSPISGWVGLTRAIELALAAGRSKAVAAGEEGP